MTDASDRPASLQRPELDPGLEAAAVRYHEALARDLERIARHNYQEGLVGFAEKDRALARQHREHAAAIRAMKSQPAAPPRLDADDPLLKSLIGEKLQEMAAAHARGERVLLTAEGVVLAEIPPPKGAP